MAGRATAVRRYAEATFELAQRDGTLDAWQADLRLAADLLKDERVLRIVDNPAVPRPDREALLDEMLASRISRPALNLIKLLGQRGRLEHLPVVVAEYTRLLNKRRGIVTATVKSALPLTDDEVAAIKARVEEMTTAQVELETSIDPRLIGGLTVQVGDRMIDASVRGRLERLRNRLVAGTR